MLQIVRYPFQMVVYLLCIRLPFLGRKLFCIVVLPQAFELSLNIFLAYTCLVLVMLYPFHMLYLRVDCLTPLGS